MKAAPILQTLFFIYFIHSFLFNTEAETSLHKKKYLIFVFMHQIPKASVKICLYILKILIQIKGVGNFFKINSDL